MAKKKKKKSGGGLKAVIIVAVITFLAGAFVIIKYPEKVSRPFSTQRPAAEAAREVSLYLSDEEGLQLKAIKQKITKAPLEAELEETVAALIKDPSRTIPEGTRLLGVSVKEETAFVDFSSEIMKNHPGGSSGETQTIYSIVDTITLNFPKVKEVQILVEGKAEETLAGHIDISLPLGPDRDIIKK